MKKLLGLLAIAPLTLSACGSNEVEVKLNDTDLLATIENVGNDAQIIFGEELSMVCFVYDPYTLEVYEAVSLRFDYEFTTLDITYVTELGVYFEWEGWIRLDLQEAKTYVAELEVVREKYIAQWEYCDY